MRQLFGLFLYFALAMAAAANEPAAVVENENTTVRVYSDRQAVAPGEPFWLAVELDPAEGWHTYWLNPGDSGMRNSFDWTLPEDAKAGAAQYPTPKRLPLGPLMNYGYKDAALLLVKVTPPETLVDETFPVALSADWLVCADVCVPESGALSFDLPVSGAAAQPDNQALFDAARAALPKANPWSISARQNGETVSLDVATGADALRGLKEAYFFPRESMLIKHPDPQRVSVGDQGFTLTAPMAAGADPSDRLRGVLKVMGVDGTASGYRIDTELQKVALSAQADAGAGAGDAVHNAGTGAGSGAAADAPASTGAARRVADLGLPMAILFALIGGLILNLMPCVFPVLSLKALAMVQNAESDAAVRRGEGVAYTLGVVGSMLTVAGVLLALKGAGQAIGWGFQLQNPWIVLALILVLFAVGLNLAGLFEVGGRLAGLGQALTQREGRLGAFFTGVLATVVATPCTAPFMTVALGFALTQSAFVALTIFAALGLGLALPILAITFIPVVGRALPRPGAWMTVFKQALSFPVFLTVVWLLWVLGQQSGIDGAAAALAAMVVVAFGIWLSTVWGGRAAWRAVGATVLVAFVGAWTSTAPDFLVARTQGTASVTASADGPAKEAFDQAALDDLRARGEPVFVYFTAAWCITCQMNERVALQSDKVKRFLNERDIHVMVGDWTNRNDRIARVLERYGRSGVPLYLFFTGQGEPVILPQVLTPGGVVSAMDTALSGAAATRAGS